MRIFPEGTLNEVNDALDSRRVLEFIGYKADKLQDTGDTIRAFCPIHRETVFRTLVVNKDRRTFRCMYGLCDGAEGGSLVRLLALSRRINEHEAAEALVDEFGISIRIPQDPELMKKNAEVAENYLELGYLDDAVKTFRAILEAEPSFERGHAGLLKAYIAQGDEEGQGRCRQALVRLALQNRQFDSALDQARELANSRPQDAACRKLVAECFLEMRDKESALEEFMAAADIYEATADWHGAIDAYKRIEDLDVDIVDISPHMIHAFTQAGQVEDCVDHINGKAQRAANHADFTTAATELEQLFDVVPDRAEVRSKWIEYALLASPREDYLPRVLEAADHLRSVGEKERAIDALRRVLTHWPRLPEAVDRLHAAFVEAGRTGEAADLRVDQARNRLEQVDADGAMELLQGVLDDFPTHQGALLAAADAEDLRGNAADANGLLVRLAVTSLEQGNFAGAAEVLERAATADPANPDIAMRRAEALEALGRGGNVDALERASRAWEGVGDLYQDASTGRSATSHYLRASSLGPTRPELLSKLARSRFRSGDTHLARVAALEAMDALERSGGADTALAEGEYFAELLPADLGLAQRIANLHRRAGRPDEARERLRRTARAAVSADDAATAERALREALEAEPECLELLEDLAALHEGRPTADEPAATLRRIADVRMARGDTAEAIAVLERVAGIAPDDADTLARLVAVYTAEGEAAAAHLWRGELARVWRERDDREAEARVLAEGLAEFPEDKDFLAWTAECLFARQRPEEACVVARRLASLHLAAGNREAALGVLRPAADRTPEDRETASVLFDVCSTAPAADDTRDRARRLADLQVRANQPAEAALTYAAVGGIYPDDIGWKYEELDLLCRVGLMAEALECSLVLAEAKRGGGDTGEAERLLFGALERSPGEARLHRALADLFHETGDAAREREQTRALANALHAGGDSAGALKVARGVVAQDAADVDTRRMVVGFLRALERAEEARTELLNIADLLRKNGDAEGALASEREAAALFPADVPTRMRVVTTLRGMGRADEAGDELESLAAALTAAERLPEAMDILNGLVEGDPERLSAMRQRAELLMKMGEEERAKAEFRVVTARMRLRQALQHRDAGEHDRESQVLRDALTFSPGDPRILYELITCEFLRNDDGAACAAARQLAAVQREAGNSADARATLASALDRRPDEVDTLRDLFDLLRGDSFTEEAVSRGLALVELLLEGGREADAVAVYDQVVETDPDNLRLRMSRIEFLRRIGRTLEALERQFELACIHHKREEYDEAEFTYLQVLASGPDHVGARERLVDLYEFLGNDEKAQEQLLQLADVLHGAHEDERAVEAVRRVLARQHDHVAARMQLVRYHREGGRQEDALAELHTLADIHRAAENEDAALEAEREATVAAPRNVPARLRYADALVAANHITVAIPELEQLAELQVDTGEYEDALETLDRVLQMSPDRPSTLIKRAEIFSTQGSQDKALEAYRRVAMQAAQGSVPGGVPLAGSASGARDGFLQLVKEYDFDHFVVGTHNNFAHATARAVANAPARAYNPLFIYSDVGLGKTHLVNAIANQVLRQDPRARIIYTNSEDFTDELVHAIQNNAINAFRTRYKSVDMLVVDDVQFLSGKERAQEEFFHIFNALFQSKRQIVVTSDRPPKDIAHLENRLRSRFGAGVIVDIAAPDYETRAAILNREIQASELGIDPAIASLIAGRVDSNVRELKGALNQVVAMRAIMGMDVTEDAVRQMLDSRYAKA